MNGEKGENLGETDRKRKMETVRIGEMKGNTSKLGRV